MKTHSRMRYGLFVLLASASACSLSDDDGGGPREQWALNAIRWDRQGYSDYEFDLTRTCFCAFFGTHRIVVQADTVVSIYSEEREAFLNTDELDDMATIEDLFRIIEQAMEQEAHVLEVTYHPTLGYPTEIVIDYIQHAVDDEVYYRVDNLKPNG